MVQEFTLSRILAPFLKENPKIVKPRKNKTQLSILQPSFRFSHLAVRDGGDHPNEPEKYDDESNESEMSEDVDNPTSPIQTTTSMDGPK